MDERDEGMPVLERLIKQRLSLVGTLAESLELSSTALARNDAEAIARGAAHQAELCRQWNALETELRRAAEEEGKLLAITGVTALVRPQHLSGQTHELHGTTAAINNISAVELSRDETMTKELRDDSAAMARSAQLQADWEKVSMRIRYLIRVHSSLLRHSQRSLAIIERVVHSCDPTYSAPRLTTLPIEMHLGE